MNEFDVVIVGAGAAGLAALQALDRAGLSAVVLEARGRIGGRIHTIHDPLSALPVELGAEFIHGRPQEIWDIIRDAGLAVYDGSDTSHSINHGEIDDQSDRWESMGAIFRKMKETARRHDMSFEQFVAATSHSEESKVSARGYIEGFNAADSAKISIQALVEEMNAADQIEGDTSFRLSTGYDAVAFHLLRSVPNWHSKLRVNQPVKQIDWTPNAVSVRTEHATWIAQKAIITVPLGLLQAKSIKFSPEPSAITEAAQALEFGQVFRVVLRFREAFWETRDKLKDVGFLFSQEELFRTWWTTLARRSTLLTAWCAGRRTEALLNMSQSEIENAALTSLAEITGFKLATIRSQLECIYYHDWSRDKYSLGAYSYVPAGALWARKQIADPVQGTLFFAGEATDQSGHSATVHGAIASGRRAAQQLLNQTS